MSNVTLSLGFATAAAMSALSGTAIAAPAASHDAAATSGDQVVHCYGVNTCKGTSDCATKANSCKGQNECKGQGFKALSVKGCTAAGGSTTAPAN